MSFSWLTFCIFTIYLSTGKNKPMESIIAQRIKNSRLHKGLSLQEVADKVGVSKQMISKYEKGESMPGSDKLISLSKLFNQKIDYFFRKSEVEIGEINFRKRSTFGTKKVNALKEEIRIRIENYLYIENILNLNHTFLHPLSDFKIEKEADIITAASSVKKFWNIGEDSLYNIIELLEEKNIKVIEVEDDTNKFDGLATIVDNLYHIIVIKKNSSVERKRFTLLHELGHLILNFSDTDEKMQEKFCQQFASEMLLSADNLVFEFGEHRSSVSSVEVINVQKKYGISFPAIVYKLGEQNIISKSRIENFYKKINFNPDFKKMFNASRYEGSEYSVRFENLVLRAVSEELISVSKASSILQLSMTEMKTDLNLNIG